jgi:hypothetical protein
MKIHLLDESLQVEIFYEKADQSYADNICMQITEECPEDERLFRAHQTCLYLTPQQACQLAAALTKAAKCSLDD